MLNLHCTHCGATLKVTEVKVTSFYTIKDTLKYKDYAVECSKCGGSVVWNKYAEKAEENKQKALARRIKKTQCAPIVSNEGTAFKASLMQCSEQQIRDFYSAIIMRALKDYGDKKQQKGVEEFFKSKHGQNICENVDISADFVLRGLKSGKIKVNEDDD